MVVRNFEIVILFLFIINRFYTNANYAQFDNDDYFDKTIRNQVDFESIRTTSKYGLVVSFKIHSDEHKEFNKVVVKFVQRLHSNFILINYEHLKAYLLDCSTTSVKEFCQKNDNYILLTLFEKDRLFQVEMTPDVKEPNESQYLNMLFQFFRPSWPNFFELYDGKQLKDFITDEKQPKQKWALCYGEPAHVLGKNFCYQVGSIYRKLTEISVGYVETLQQMETINEFLNLGIKTKDVLPMFALWFVDCLTIGDDKVQCKSRKYLADDLKDNVHLFMKLNFMPSLGKMKKFGSITEMGPVPAPVLFCFHNNATRQEMRQKAVEFSEKLRGYAFVVLVNVEFVDDEFLTRKMKLSTDDYDRFPFYKLWPRTGTEPQTNIGDLVDVTGDPEDYVFKFYANVFDLKSIFVTTATAEQLANSTALLAEDDAKTQDDDVEIVLHHLKEQRCFQCPLDWKNVVELNENTVNQYTTSMSVKFVLFWVKVDTMSKAAAEIFAAASDLVSGDYFGSLGCHDYPDICTKLSVTTWPRITIYKNGKQFGDYNGLLEPETIVNAVLMHLQSPIVMLHTEEELRKFSEGHYLSLANGKFLPTATLVLAYSPAIPEFFEQAADKLSGRYLIGWYMKDKAKHWFKEKFGDKLMPLMITFKSQDPIEPYQFSPDNIMFTVDNIVSFVQDSSRPKLANFTQNTFPFLFKNSIPLLILLSDKPKKSDFYHLFLKLPECLTDKFQCTIWNYKQERELTMKILDKWHLVLPDRDTVLYLDFHKSIVYAYRYEAREKNFREWLESIFSNPDKANPVVQLSKQPSPIDRPLMFNYLSLIYGKPLVGPKVVEKMATKTENGLKGPAKPLPTRIKTEL